MDTPSGVAPPPRDSWTVAPVPATAPHFELRYGSADSGDWDFWTPVARVGRRNAHRFTVEFLVAPDSSERTEMIAAVTGELNFYLVELRERDPWGYARYHCGTASNIYSDVHWAYVTPERSGQRTAPTR